MEIYLIFSQQQEETQKLCLMPAQTQKKRAILKPSEYYFHLEKWFVQMNISIWGFVLRVIMEKLELNCANNCVRSGKPVESIQGILDRVQNAFWIKSLRFRLKRFFRGRFHNKFYITFFTCTPSFNAFVMVVQTWPPKPQKIIFFLDFPIVPWSIWHIRT